VLSGCGAVSDGFTGPGLDWCDDWKPVAGSEAAVVDAALDSLVRGEAFTADARLSTVLRQTVAAEKAFGYTVPAAFGGAGASYGELAAVEEALASNGLGALAVEISGQLTIGAGSLLAYGDEPQQRTFLPLVAEGRPMAFGLTEVGVGVNAKKVQAYAEEQADGDYRLFAEGAANKLWITNAVHGGLVGIVARLGRQSQQLGLFIVELPTADVVLDAEHDYEFRCEPSRVAAFVANFNSRLHFRNFRVPAANRIAADGVEVLFYCLRMGRCMLAAMAAGYQRMLARDASYYARQRVGVGGPRQLVQRVEEHAVVRLAGEHLPELLGGEREDRRHQSNQGVRDVPQRSLRRAPRHRVRAAGIEAILQDVEVERAQVLGAERLQALRHEVELVARVVGGNLLLHARGHGEGVAVHLQLAFGRHRVPCRVEVNRVGE